MSAPAPSPARYQEVADAKAAGATYTPRRLADFVSDQIIRAAENSLTDAQDLRLLDPAIGDGELLCSLLSRLPKRETLRITVVGFETDPAALARARSRLQRDYPDVRFDLRLVSFLEYVLAHTVRPTLFSGDSAEEKFDLIIANPPYVRTQIIGAADAQQLARTFGLTGRVDLYHAFLIGMSKALKPTGTAGVIVSNRFMTTKGAGAIRAALRGNWCLQHIWDLGDTKLFDAAVLPAVVLAGGHATEAERVPRFSSIYATTEGGSTEVEGPLEALDESGLVTTTDGRSFDVKHGTLAVDDDLSSVWRIATDAGDDWMEAVASKTWATFGDLGKIRVGVKTCADKVFIRSGWSDASEENPPELLRRLTTHHVARRFKAASAGKWRDILYPHTSEGGVRRPVNLNDWPISRAYLEANRSTLEARSYVIAGGRQWFELWVPQDPALWSRPKLVFRDISECPTFWVDLDQTVVNGDCYWLVTEKLENEELLWLAAAVSNSTFIESFYDRRFNNKLYGGRRRFITQYVEQFPLPDPTLDTSKDMIDLAKSIYELEDGQPRDALEARLDGLVWEAFGLPIKEAPR